MEKLTEIIDQARACRLCAASLPHAPRPVLVADARARLLIIGQAPGARVHASGIPWDDPSGDRLRDWLAVDKSQFYGDPRIAIVPMGFCYPGKGRSGDLPPRPECAPTWHSRLLAQMPAVELVLLIGQYAQRYYLNDGNRSLTERVAEHVLEDYFFPLPHPSPRNIRWFKQNPWFEAQRLPALRRRVAAVLSP